MNDLNKTVIGRVEKVKPLRFNSNRGFYVVGYKVSGTWKYVWRRSENDALEVYEQLCAMRDESKANISRKSTELTNSQLAEAELAVDKLRKKYGREETMERRLLVEAVELFIKRTPTLKAPYLDEVVDMFLEYKETKVVDTTHRDYVHSLNKLRMVYGDVRVNEITTKMMRDYFELYCNVRCRLVVQYLRSFFNWCCGKDNAFTDDSKGWMESNPITWHLPSPNWREPNVLSFDGIVNTLIKVGPLCNELSGIKKNNHWYSRNANQVIAYYIFRLFSMIRRHEYLRLIALGGGDVSENKYIDFERKRIILTPDIYRKRGCMTQTSAGRIFEPICDTFWEWIVWMKEMRIPLTIPRGRHQEEELRMVCEEEKISPRNILRHTAITNHLLKFKDMALTSKNAGTSLSMIQKHYWGKNVPTSDAEKMYELNPQMALDLCIIRNVVKRKIVRRKISSE